MENHFSKYLRAKFAAFICLIIPLAIMLNSCSKSPAVKEDKFIKLYVDMLIAQDTSKANGKQLEIVKKQVLKKYSVSESEYDSTLNFYNEDPKRWSEFFDKAITYLEQLKKRKNS